MQVNDEGRAQERKYVCKGRSIVPRACGTRQYTTCKIQHLLTSSSQFNIFIYINSHVPQQAAQHRAYHTLYRFCGPSKLFLLPQFRGCLFKNAPTAPRYPSCLRKYACFVPLDQNRIA